MLRVEDHSLYEKARRDRGGMRARIDWLELLNPSGPEVDAIVTIIAEHGVPIDPTLVAYDTKFSYDAENARPVAPRYRENKNLYVVDRLPEIWRISGSNTDNWTAEDFQRMEAAWPKLLALVKRYHEGGVLLTAGSDTPNPWVIPGESLHRELERLVGSGISADEVILIATRNGAEALGLLEETGTVEAGKRADLVLLAANPLIDISNTRQIVWVMREGRRYWYRTARSPVYSREIGPFSFARFPTLSLSRLAEALFDDGKNSSFSVILPSCYPADGRFAFPLTGD